MRSTQALASARMSDSGRRMIVHPDLTRYASLARSFFFCFSSPCQYVPSASTATIASGMAMSMTNGPIWYSISKAIERAFSSSCSAFSMLLVRGHVDATYAPEQRREQNRNLDTRDGLTSLIVPHHSQAIFGFSTNSGWSVPVIERFHALLHSREQNLALPTRFGCTPNSCLHWPHVMMTGGSALCADLPIVNCLAIRALAADFGLARPVWLALTPQDREQYLPRPVASRAGDALVRNVFPHLRQLRSSMRQLYHKTAAIASQSFVLDVQEMPA